MFINLNMKILVLLNYRKIIPPVKKKTLSLLW